MSRVLMPPEMDHFHTLPEIPHVEGALTACSTCHQWMRSWFEYQAFGGGYVWRPVRWWHWRLRSRIEAYIRQERDDWVRSFQ